MGVTDRQTNRQINRQTDRQTDRQTHRYTDTQTHRHTDFCNGFRKSLVSQHKKDYVSEKMNRCLLHSTNSPVHLSELINFPWNNFLLNFVMFDYHHVAKEQTKPLFSLSSTQQHLQ